MAAKGPNSGKVKVRIQVQNSLYIFQSSLSEKNLRIDFVMYI